MGFNSGFKGLNHYSTGESRLHNCR